MHGNILAFLTIVKVYEGVSKSSYVYVTGRRLEQPMHCYCMSIGINSTGQNKLSSMSVFSIGIMLNFQSLVDYFKNI